MAYPYSDNSEYDIRRKSVPVPHTYITSPGHGDGPGEYETTYRPDAQSYHDKTPHLAVQPEPPQGPKPNYKPSPLRWPFLCALVAILLGLIALTEYACHVLPAEDIQVFLPTTRSVVAATPTPTPTPTVGKRQDPPPGSPGDGSIATPSVGDEAGSMTTLSDGRTITATRPKSDFGSVGSVILTPSGDDSTPNQGPPESTRPPSDHGSGGLVTVTDPLVLQTPEIVTLTDPQGIPTATSTSTPPPLSTPTVVTLTDANGNPTMVLTSAPAPPVTSVFTDANGVPTATVTQYPVAPTGPADGRHVFFISQADYFIGYFLPAMLCVLLTIPVRMIELSAKQFQPFHQLTHEFGAPARDSLVLQTGGIQGFMTSVRSLFGGQALIFLTTMLSICSMVLVPVAVEAVSLKLHGSCSQLSFKGCAMTLGVFLIPARVAVGILGFMVVILLLMLVVLRDWRSGVATNPWSIAGMAVLSTNPDVRALFASLPTGRSGRIGDGQLADALDGRMFKLGYFVNRHGQPEYGIMVHNEAGQPLHRPDDPAGEHARHVDFGEEPYRMKRQHYLPFLMLSYGWRILFLLLLSGMLAVILYYNNTGGDTPFERFMDMQSFGVRFLFTALGVITTFFWSSFFSSLALLSPYHQLSKSPQPAGQSILLSPPMTAFTGVFSAMRRRHGFLGLVGVTAILSEFMPILLNNVPFRVTQTWVAHMVCTWLSVGILGIMWLVVVGSFFVRWPHMPVDPSTVAGAMYYLCDSWILWSLEGMSTLKKKERDWKISETGLKFRFGEIEGVSGLRRVGIDGVRDSQP